MFFLLEVVVMAYVTAFPTVWPSRLQHAGVAHEIVFRTRTLCACVNSTATKRAHLFYMSAYW